ncbi:Carnitinyl-CoA dehydratase [compost metagenome]
MILSSQDGHIATLTLSRPPANAFSAEGLRQLRDLVAEINANPEIRAIVVTGAGEKFFSAGADLKRW